MTKISKRCLLFAHIFGNFKIFKYLKSLFPLPCVWRTLIHTLESICIQPDETFARVMHGCFFLRRHGSTAGFGIRLHRLLDEDSKLKLPELVA